MSINSAWADIPGLKKRFLLLSVLAAAVFLLLLMRLWYLQIIGAERYRLLSEKNRIRYVPIAAERGPIYDRDGVLLVDNRPAFDVAVLRQDVEDRDRLLQTLAPFLEVDPDLLNQRWQAGRSLPRYRPVPLATDVGRAVMDRVQENSLEMPGVLIQVQPIRAYPHGQVAAHLFGYLGEMTEKELAGADRQRFRLGDFIGKSGLEKKLEDYLRGTEGVRRVEVNVQGKEMRLLKTQEPVPGNQVFLTVQRDLQVAAEEAFGDQAGAAVVLDVHSGEILALVSRPTFDPAVFVRGMSSQEWLDLLQDDRHPLQNKAVQGQYPPGSTFKIITALAALQAKVASPATTVDCTGSITLGGREFRCWKKRGHGRTDLKKALKESCDVWFYQAALDLGIDRLAEMAQAFGLGSPVDYPLEGERDGLIPTRDWKRSRFGTSWYPGETVIAAIGQGYVLATPLQLAVMTAAMANGGTVYRPMVVKQVEDWSGNLLQENYPEVLRTVQVAPEHLQAVARGLVAAVNEPHGTGGASRLATVQVAGKTGTAQVVRLKRDDEENNTEEVPYRLREHALFVGYAPAQEPQIALAVLVEHGVSGGRAAAPIAQAIFSSYFGVEGETSDVRADVPGD